ncbi:hypothetical protein BDL97_02G112000 [Sphagnum fallax]|nr:hypothetical protein BDL97_02G112000 [Sphagnum fallax]
MGKRKSLKSSSPVLPSSPENEANGEPQESSKEEEDQPNGNSSSSPSEDSESGSEPSSGDSDSDESSGPSEDMVNVDFEFFDPRVSDFHGVKTLLRTFLDDEVWDISGFVELVLAQTTVGSVIKAGEEEDPIGVISALNLARYQECKCMEEIHKFLERKSVQKPEACNLEELWSKHSKEVGLLLSERLVNIPIELAPPLYQGLFDEVFWATEDEPTGELQEFFKFKYYLVLTRVFEELIKDEIAHENSAQRKRQKQDSQKSGELIYIKPEDEILHKLSSWSFTFPVSADSLAAHQLQLFKITCHCRISRVVENAFTCESIINQ